MGRGAEEKPVHWRDHKGTYYTNLQRHYIYEGKMTGMEGTKVFEVVHIDGKTIKQSKKVVTLNVSIVVISRSGRGCE